MKENKRLWLLHYLQEITSSEVSKVYVWLSSFKMYLYILWLLLSICFIKTLYFANQSNNILEKSDNSNYSLDKQESKRQECNFRKQNVAIKFSNNETIGTTLVIKNVIVNTKLSEKFSNRPLQLIVENQRCNSANF